MGRKWDKAERTIHFVTAPQSREEMTPNKTMLTPSPPRSEDKFAFSTAPDQRRTIRDKEGAVTASQSKVEMGVEVWDKRGKR